MSERERERERISNFKVIVNESEAIMCRKRLRGK